MSIHLNLPLYSLPIIKKFIAGGGDFVHYPIALKAKINGGEMIWIDDAIALMDEINKEA